MERFGFVFTFGLGLFVLSILLSGVLPAIALNARDGEYLTLDQLTAEVPDSFHELVTAYPAPFEKHYGLESGKKANSATYKEALQLGRDFYIAEACWHCHSQYIRPVAKETQRWGWVSEADEYNNAMYRPSLWGTRRTGPDLTRQHDVHTNDWQLSHLYDPRSTSPGSIMPGYSWFFEEERDAKTGEVTKVTPGKRAIAVVTYLRWLGSLRAKWEKERRAAERAKRPKPTEEE
jgi:cytochrome c oxidase cbb3-type subunit II